MMKVFSFLTLIVLFSSCAGSRTEREPASLVLVRAGGFSGLEERITLEENGHVKQTRRFPGEEEKVTADETLSRPEVKTLFDYLHRNIDSLRTIVVNEPSNLTTSLIINYGKDSYLMRWPGLEPPILQTRKLDTLYSLIAPVQKWLSSYR